MPILLLLGMGGLAGYLFAGQFATYVATSDFSSELLHLQAANDALAAQLIPLESSGKLSEQIAGELTRASDERFPRRTVTVWRGDKGFVLSTGGGLLETRRRNCPALSVATSPASSSIRTNCTCAQSSFNASAKACCP